MNDPSLMGGVKCVGDLKSQVEGFLSLQRPGGDVPLERFAFQVLHDDKRLPLVLADVVKRANVRMVEGRRGAGFAREALERLRVAGKLRGEELERHRPAQARVLGLVHDAHAPAAELLEYSIMRNGGPDHGPPCGIRQALHFGTMSGILWALKTEIKRATELITKCRWGYRRPNAIYALRDSSARRADSRLRGLDKQAPQSRIAPHNRRSGEAGRLALLARFFQVVVGFFRRFL